MEVRLMEVKASGLALGEISEQSFTPVIINEVFCIWCAGNRLLPCCLEGMDIVESFHRLDRVRGLVLWQSPYSASKSSIGSGFWWIGVSWTWGIGLSTPPAQRRKSTLLPILPLRFESSRLTLWRRSRPPQCANCGGGGVLKQGCEMENCKKPPGFSTLKASCMAVSGSGTSIRLIKAVAKSNCPYNQFCQKQVSHYCLRNSMNCKRLKILRLVFQLRHYNFPFDSTNPKLKVDMFY